MEKRIRNSKGQFVKIETVQTVMSKEQYIKSFQTFKSNCSSTDSIFSSENLTCIEENKEEIEKVKNVIEFLEPEFVKFDTDHDGNELFLNFYNSIFLRANGRFWANGRKKEIVIEQLHKTVENL